MAEQMTRASRSGVEDIQKEREGWLGLLGELTGQVEGWVQPEWSTRVIEKVIQDSVLGEYHAPALLMQRGVTRVLLEPITRFAPGTEGVVDLYLMPAYDDIATLRRSDGDWKIHYAFRGDPVVTGIRNTEALALTEDNFSRVLDSIANSAGSNR